MSDDDDDDEHEDTPPRHLPVMWSDDRRALQGAKYRTRLDDSGKTPVFDEPSAPATQAQLEQLLRHVRSRLDDSENGAKEQVSQFTSMMMTPTEIVEVRQALSDIKRTRNWVLGGALTALLVLGGFLFSRGFGEGRDANRIDVLERALQRLESDFGEARRAAESTIADLRRELYRRSDARRVGADSMSSATTRPTHDQN